MRQKQPILLATTSEGKIAEIRQTLGDLPFDFLSLGDIGYDGAGPEETEDTPARNAELKARYYGDRYGMIALADDSGLFLDAFPDWPGVHSARIAPDTGSRCAAVLEKLSGHTNRDASFLCSIAAYDPTNGTVLYAYGRLRGTILAAASHGGKNGFGYDPIFCVPDAGKTLSEMSVRDKNAISHRGKALAQMKFILQNQYGGKHIVVPCAIIVRDGMVLLSKRHDPFRPEFHGKWEFPGGRMDIGETLEENVVRETAEEVGYDIVPVKRLSEIWVEFQRGDTWAYQVYLIPYVCRIIGGNGALADAEVLEVRWFSPEEVLQQELIGANKELYRHLLPELRQCILQEHL
jgi:XTP/dITP diphosphohydrolase